MSDEEPDDPVEAASVDEEDDFEPELQQQQEEEEEEDASFDMGDTEEDPLGLSVSVDEMSAEVDDDTPEYVPRFTKLEKGKFYIHPTHGKSKFLGNSQWACSHGLRRTYCHECGGGGMCPHKRRRTQCVDCNGSQICQHKRSRAECVDCKGALICPHKQRRDRCKKCKGAQICLHSRIRGTCRDCKGSSRCEHDRLRFCCKDCQPIDKMLTSGIFCCICTVKLLGPTRMFRKGGSGICAECEPDAKKRLEHRVRDALLPMVSQSPEAMQYVRFGTDCDYQDKAFRMPDFLWTVYSSTGQLAGIIKVGIDEDSHSEYTAECEGGKVSNQHEALNELAFRMDRELAKGTQSKLTPALLAKHIETRKEAKLATELGGRRLLPQFYLKVNFDGYDGPCTTWETRLKTIANRVNVLLTHLRDGAPGTDTTLPHVEFYWYHSKSAFIVNHFKASATAVYTTVYS